MRFALVTIGGSAGALGPLRQLVANLPADIPAAVFVVTHVPPDSVSAMPHILSRSGPLFATHAIDGAPIGAGRIAIAPPNCHLVIERGVMRVVDWAKENGQRPSIDVLFRSAAQAYGDAVCGVLLSGALDDGVAGLQSIRSANGVAIVQTPDDALFPDMPANAIEAGAATLTGSAIELGDLVARSVEEIMRSASGAPAHDSDEAGNLRFRCRTGHAYNVSSISSAQENTLESSLWTALRILEERMDFFHGMSRRSQARGDTPASARYRDRAQELDVHFATIREALADVVNRRRSSAS